MVYPRGPEIHCGPKKLLPRNYTCADDRPLSKVHLNNQSAFSQESPCNRKGSLKPLPRRVQVQMIGVQVTRRPQYLGTVPARYRTSGISIIADKHAQETDKSCIIRMPDVDPGMQTMNGFDEPYPYHKDPV